MTWPQIVERWRQYVDWESNDIPIDLVLSIIKKESGGVPGKKAGATTKPWEIPTYGGGTIVYNRALGLMQVVPRTIASYNNRHPSDPAFFEDMSGKDDRAARVQIRVGCEIFSREVLNAHNYDQLYFPARVPGEADTNQLKIAILGYRMGFGNTRKKLNKLRDMGEALTYENIKKHFPNWGMNADGQWINRPIFYTDKVWEAALNNGMVPGQPSSGEGPALPPVPQPVTAGGGGGLLAIGAILLFAFFWKGSKR